MCDLYLGPGGTCSAWQKAGLNYGCRGGGEFYNLDSSLHMTETASCSALCTKEDIFGCCYLSSKFGCYWLTGGFAVNDSTSDHTIAAVNCYGSGEPCDKVILTIGSF